jgi:hypothetical protein
VVNRRLVDSVLQRVVAGLTVVTSIPAHSSIAHDAGALATASQDFATASQGAGQLGAGVPGSVSSPVVSRLASLGQLFGTAARCLQHQASAKVPDTRKCVPPLRRANANDAELSRELISLAVYSSQSPKTFEAQLVKALHKASL